MDLSACLGLTDIGKDAFYDNLLTSVILPSGLTKIGNGAFADNPGLVRLALPSGALDGFTDNWRNGNGVEVQGGAPIDHGTSYVRISNLHTLTDGDLTVSGGVLESYTYSGTGQPPTVIAIPENLHNQPITGIREYAFRDNLLTSVDLPKGLTKIGEYTFYDNLLTSVDLPKRLTGIGNGAFADNPGLVRLALPSGALDGFTDNWRNGNGVEVQGGEAIDHGTSYIRISNLHTLTDGDVTVSGGILESYTYSGTDWPPTVIAIPGDLDNQPITGIGENAFKGKLLASALLPTGLTKIGENAFSYNELSSVDLPTGLTKIGENAFYGNLLSSVDLPTGLTKIGTLAFAFNPNLASLTLPGGAPPQGYADDWTDGSGQSHARGGVVSDFYTSYQANAIPYGITYNLGGGVQHADNPISYTVKDLPLVLKAPTRRGYNFDGWYGGADFTDPALTGIGTGSTGPRAFHAKWELNQAPTGITLDKTAIAENMAPGTLIGTLSTTDPDEGDEHT